MKDQTGFIHNPHVQTMLPFLLRRPINIKFQRESIDSPDGDFIDLDWARISENQPSTKLAVIIYGLEGDRQCTYTTHAIKKLSMLAYDSVIMNLRGCSRPNRLLKTYHSGQSEDLETTLNWILAKEKYSEIVLIGFSLGGNIVLKYLGEQANKLNHYIKKAIAISPPIDLEATSLKLAKPDCAIYMTYWLYKFRQKILRKMKMFPSLDIKGFSKIKTFYDYDKRYTAPLNGFLDVHDYWRQASSKPLLTNIAIPTLFLASKDDPFLSLESYPVEEAKVNPNLKLIITERGGHVGFWELKWDKWLYVDFYYEQYMLDFLQNLSVDKLSESSCLMN